MATPPTIDCALCGETIQGLIVPPEHRCRGAQAIEPYTIFKYALPVREEFTLSLPMGARILTVQVQHGIPVLWAIVRDPSEAERERRFAMRGTGHRLDEELTVHDTYIATSHLHDGDLVFHLFERDPP